MKNLQKYLMILETIMLSIGISACSKQPDLGVNNRYSPMREYLRLKHIRELLFHVHKMYVSVHFLHFPTFHV